LLATYLIQFGYNFAVVGPVMFVPLLADSFGATPATIGLAVATYQTALFLSSWLFGRLADLKGHKLFIVLGLLVAAPAFYVHRFISDVPGLFLIRALAGITVGIFPAAVVAYASRRTSNLGRFASFGSLGWGIGSIVVGAIAVYSHSFLLAGIVFLACAIVALFALQETKERVNQTLFDLQVLKRNWRVYVSFFLRHAGAMGIWAIFPVYLERLGANKLWIGIIYAINAVGQFVFMPLLDRYPARTLIRMGFYGSVLTFLSFALCVNFWQLLPFQVLLALSWSCLYVGSLKYLIEHNPERSTAVGGLNSVLSLSGIVGAALGGALAGVPLAAGFTSLLARLPPVFMRLPVPSDFSVVMLAAALMAVAGAFVFRF
jgi:MFS family permease